jgi:hypothetical protein
MIPTGNENKRWRDVSKANLSWSSGTTSIANGVAWISTNSHPIKAIHWARAMSQSCRNSKTPDPGEILTQSTQSENSAIANSKCTTIVRYNNKPTTNHKGVNTRNVDTYRMKETRTANQAQIRVCISTSSTERMTSRWRDGQVHHSLRTTLGRFYVFVFMDLLWPMEKNRVCCCSEDYPEEYIYDGIRIEGTPVKMYDWMSILHWD